MYQIDGLFVNRINQRSCTRETPSPQHSVSSASSVHIPDRPSSAQTSYSEPIVNITTPNRPSSAQTLYSVPLTTDLVSKFRRTSTSLPPPPQNTDGNIITHSIQPDSSNPHTSTISITSDEIIVPPRQNIFNAALLKAYEDFE